MREMVGESRFECLDMLMGLSAAVVFVVVVVDNLLLTVVVFTRVVVSVEIVVVDDNVGFETYALTVCHRQLCAAMLSFTPGVQ